MSTTSTPNYGLEKPTPDTGEPADIALINGNMDIIDAALDELQTSVTAGSDANTATNGDVSAIDTRVDTIEANNPGLVRMHPPIYKNVQQEAESFAGLQDDDDFTFAAEAGRTYYGTLNIGLADLENGGADFKCGWEFPAGRFSMFVRAPDVSFTHGDVVDQTLMKAYRGFDSHTSQAHIGVSELGVASQINFVFKCTTSGQVTFQWGQNTSIAHPIRLLSDSHMTLMSVATP